MSDQSPENCAIVHVTQQPQDETNLPPWAQVVSVVGIILAMGVSKAYQKPRLMIATIIVGIWLQPFTPLNFWTLAAAANNAVKTSQEYLAEPQYRDVKFVISAIESPPDGSLVICSTIGKCYTIQSIDAPRFMREAKIGSTVQIMGHTTRQADLTSWGTWFHRADIVIDGVNF